MITGPFRRMIVFFSSLGLGFIYLPIFGVLFGSVFWPSPEDGTLHVSWEGFHQVGNNSEILTSLGHSLEVAFLTSLTTLLIAILFSYAIQNYSEFRLEKIRRLFYLPLLLPEIVIGISLLLWYVLIKFSLGQTSLIVSHVTFTLPYAIILLTIGIEGIDKNLFEAARDLGAHSWQIFIYLVFPLLKSTYLGVFLLSFVISFDDFLISYFTAGAGFETLPMKLYSLMRFGLSAELKAISALILLSSFALSALLVRFLHLPKAETEAAKDR